jgi:hypothetical protein
MVTHTKRLEKHVRIEKAFSEEGMIHQNRWPRVAAGIMAVMSMEMRCLT